MNPSSHKLHAGWRAFAFLVLALGLTPLLAADTPTAGDDRRIIMEDVKINGKPVRFAFDTGAEAFAIYLPAAERLGLKFTVVTADETKAAGGTRFGATDPVAFQLGPKTVTTQLAVMDPGGVRPDVDGFIGWGPLRTNFIIFDAANSDFTLAAIGKTPEPASAWQQLPLRKDSKVMVFEIPAQKDQPSGILIDTGDDGGVELAPARWREWRAAHPTAPTTMTANFFASSGLIVREMAWAKELTVGSLTLTDVPVQVAHDATPRYGATLGIEAFKRQNVVVDGEKGMGYFARQQIPARPFQHNRLGAVFTPSDMQHDPLEAHVALGTPADAAGIHNGDVLLKIDALDATKWRTDPAVLPMSRFWERPAGTKYVLTLKRADKEFAVTVTLRDILGPGTTPADPKPAPPPAAKP